MTIYPVEEITTVAQVEALIEFAELEKKEATTKIGNKDYRSVVSTKSGKEKNDDLAVAEAEVVSIVSQMAAHAVDSDKWRRLEGKRQTLVSRIYNIRLDLELGTSSITDKIKGMYNHTGLVFQETESEILLTQLRAKKATL